MKKAFIPLMLALLLCGVSLAACGKTGGETGAATTASATAEKYYAEVADVIGNQLTLKQLTGSFDPEAISQMMGSRQNRTGPDGEVVTGRFFVGGDGEGGQRPEGAQRIEGRSLPEGFSLPENFSFGEGMSLPEGFSGGFQRPTDENGEPVTMPSRYTGEEKEVVIPIGTPIKSFSFTDGELKTKDAEIADIKNGGAVQLIYEGERIVEVQIIDMGRMGGGGMITGMGPGGGAGFGPDGMPNFPPNADVDIFYSPDGGVAIRAQIPD